MRATRHTRRARAHPLGQPCAARATAWGKGCAGSRLGGSHHPGLCLHPCVSTSLRVYIPGCLHPCVSTSLCVSPASACIPARIAPAPGLADTAASLQHPGQSNTAVQHSQLRPPLPARRAPAPAVARVSRRRRDGGQSRPRAALGLVRQMRRPARSCRRACRVEGIASLYWGRGGLRASSGRECTPPCTARAARMCLALRGAYGRCA